MSHSNFPIQKTHIIWYPPLEGEHTCYGFAHNEAGTRIRVIPSGLGDRFNPHLPRRIHAPQPFTGEAVVLVYDATQETPVFIAYPRDRAYELPGIHEMIIVGSVGDDGFIRQQSVKGRTEPIRIFKGDDRYVDHHPERLSDAARRGGLMRWETIGKLCGVASRIPCYLRYEMSKGNRLTVYAYPSKEAFRERQMSLPHISVKRADELNGEATLLVCSRSDTPEGVAANAQIVSEARHDFVQIGAQQALHLVTGWTYNVTVETRPEKGRWHIRMGSPVFPEIF